jgi:hypothetical protein
VLLQARLSGSSLLQGLLVALAAALVSAGLAYGIGVRVTDRWDERKRRREADLTALAEFYLLMPTSSRHGSCGTVTSCMRRESQA